QRIIHQIDQGAFKQSGIGINFASAATLDADMSIFRNGSVETCNFFYDRSTVESLSLNRLAGGIHTRDKKQIIDDRRKPFAFNNHGRNEFTVFLWLALARQSHLRFAEHVCDGCAEFVREIGRKLREPREGILEPAEHLIEGDGERLKLSRPTEWLSGSGA